MSDRLSRILEASAATQRQASEGEHLDSEAEEQRGFLDDVSGFNVYNVRPVGKLTRHDISLPSIYKEVELNICRM